MVQSRVGIELDPRSLIRVEKKPRKGLFYFDKDVMRTIYLVLRLLSSSAFIAACGSTEIRSEKPRLVNLSSASEDSVQKSSGQVSERKYEDSLSCKLMEQAQTSSFESERISALNGFVVGPQSAIYASDLTKPILRSFSSDGCSSSPDGVPLTEDSSVWVDCCIRHDTVYWMGGSREQKNQADEELKSCMAEKGYPNVGKVYKSFVAEFGGPTSSQSYRWGYGWNYKRNFSKLTTAEDNQIKRLYGVDQNQFSDFMMKQKFSLQRVCDPTDPIFYGLRKEEIETYHFLNQRLKKQDVIVWARLKNFNLVSYSYEIKLQSCHEPVIVTLFKDAGKASELQSSCEL